MGRIIDFLRYCYNSEMYSEGETPLEIFGKYFGIAFSFFVILPFYFLWFFCGYLLMKLIVETFFSSDLLIREQWLFLLYGLLFGLFLSVIFQGIPRHGDTPKNIGKTLIHHLIFLSTFILALVAWSIIVIIALKILGFIH